MMPASPGMVPMRPAARASAGAPRGASHPAVVFAATLASVTTALAAASVEATVLVEATVSVEAAAMAVTDKSILNNL